MAARFSAISRRSLLFRISALALAASAPVFDGAEVDKHDRLTRALDDPSRLDMETLTHTEEILERCRRQGDVLGPEIALQTAMAQQQVIGRILPGAPSAVRKRALCILRRHHPAHRLAAVQPRRLSWRSALLRRRTHSGSRRPQRRARHLYAVHHEPPGHLAGQAPRGHRPRGGCFVDVVIADRDPFVPGRVIDRSEEAFQRLAPLGAGVLDIKVEW